LHFWRTLMISTRIRILSSVVMLFSVLHSTHCAAAVIAYDNITDALHLGGTYIGKVDYGEIKLAQRFTATTSGQLSKLAMTLVFFPTQRSGLIQNIDEITLSIVADENGKPGTTDLWSEVFIDKTEPAVSWPGYQPLSSFSVANG